MSDEQQIKLPFWKRLEEKHQVKKQDMGLS